MKADKSYLEKCLHIKLFSLMIYFSKKLYKKTINLIQMLNIHRLVHIHLFLHSVHAEVIEMNVLRNL